MLNGGNSNSDAKKKRVFEYNTGNGGPMLFYFIPYIYTAAMLLLILSDYCE